MRLANRMLSIYYFLVEFFLDVPTLGSAISRSLKIFSVCMLLLGVCMVLQVPAEYASIIYLLTLSLPCFILARYTQQHFGSKRS